MTSPKTVTGRAVPGTRAAVVRVPESGLAGRLCAEALGSFLLVFGGLGIALFNGSGSSAGVPVGIGFGLALIAGLVAFGHISGGHFNPAVSFAAALAGKIKWLQTLWYVVAQVIGAIVATLVLFAVLNVLPAVSGSGGKLTTHTLFNSLANGFDSHSPSTVPLAGALLIEVVGTAIFVAVFLGATQARANRTLAPIGIGLAYAAVITVALPITNASINPARSTAAAIFADGWAAQQLWLFWVAPLLGAAVAGLLFRAFSTGSAVRAGAAGVAGDDAFDGDDAFAGDEDEDLDYEDIDGTPGNGGGHVQSKDVVLETDPAVTEAGLPGPVAATRADGAAHRSAVVEPAAGAAEPTTDAQDFFDDKGAVK
ncbi:aquaporin [Paeniglutamicibacter antarcticus]|uniref:Aquaporin n=1 Tax=Arthrobacter terrae TaxID=2935737 RepID=A0A931G625_9MICC|nr:aquaporin [Arthrobacter terrae]MBG0741491.1 aquaporin [Arthrobacter terrae]